MTKYNLTPKRSRTPQYQSMLSNERIEELYEKIMAKFVIEKKYRDPNYTSRQMAKDLGTNTRYLSAVVNMRYQDNYSQLVNEFRIREAMYLLRSSRNEKLRMEDVAQTVGFVNRQSFYSAFYKRTGMTPRAYRLQAEQEDTME